MKGGLYLLSPEKNTSKRVNKCLRINCIGKLSILEAIANGLEKLEQMKKGKFYFHNNFFWFTYEHFFRTDS
jgi:hypothetical protein